MSLVGSRIEQNCTTEEVYINGVITDTNRTLDASGKIQSHHLSESPADSVTIFTKLRLELNSLQVDSELESNLHLSRFRMNVLNAVKTLGNFK